MNIISGLLEKIKRNRSDKFANKVVGVLNDIAKNDSLRFNPKYAKLPESSSEAFTYSVAENYTWFTGNIDNIRKFYTENVSSRYQPLGNVSYFWKKAESDTRMLHAGIPALISNRMGTVLFGAGITVETEVYKDNGEADEEHSILVSERLDAILEDNDILKLYEKGAGAESWGGHLFARISIDTSISLFPIIEFIDIRNAEVVINRGRTVAVIFKNYYEDKTQNGTKKYVHKEIYGKSEQGVATIEHHLFQITDEGEKELPLTARAETSELEPIYNFDGIFGLLAFDKPNKLPNNDFVDSPYGASDYSGAISSFDALDEVYSVTIEEARDNKSQKFVPQSLLINGVEFNQFRCKHILIKRDSDQDNPNEIQTTFFQDKTDDHIKKFNIALTTAVNKCGLSPITLGVTGLTAIDSSDKTLRERQKTTLETRQSKTKLWKEFLEQLYIRVLEVDDWMIANITGLGRDRVLAPSEKFTVKVAFNEYISNTFEERLEMANQAAQAGTMSIDEQIDYIWGDDKTDEAKREEVERLKFEKNIAFDTPDALTLTGEANE